MRVLILLFSLVLGGCPEASDDDDSGVDVDDDDTPDDDDDDASPDDDDAADDDDASPDDDDASPDDLPEGIDEIVAWLAEGSTTVQAIDELIHTVAWGESGWPMEEDGRWLFLSRWDQGIDEIYLVGDFNEWFPSAGTTTRTASGRHYLSVVEAEDFVGVPDGSAYKWLVAEDYLAPVEARSYSFDSFGRFGYVRPPTTARWIDQYPDLASAHLALTRTIRVLLPVGFEPRSPAAASYRTILAHDGQNLADPEAFFGGWRLDETLAATERDDVVVLAVDNAPDRMDVYTHVEDTLPANGEQIGGLADDYIALLENEALPDFRARYGVPAEGDSLLVMGSSLGGLVSLYMAMSRPELMGCVVAMSPTLGWGAFGSTMPGDQALARLWPASFGHGAAAIYLDSGGGVNGDCVDTDGDGILEESDDSDNYCVTGQLRDTLESVGYSFNIDLWHWHEPFAPHNEAAWSARVPQALDACEASGWSAP